MSGFIKKLLSFFSRKSDENKSDFGIDIFSDDPWLSDRVKALSIENTSFITDIPSHLLGKVAETIYHGLRMGLRYEDVAKDLQDTLGISEEKARFIARNQIKKLNSSLTRFRQENLGVTEYTFRTCGDERVRESHAFMDGKICKWSDSTVYKRNGRWVKRSKEATHHHPGEEENCRCIALPVLDKLFRLNKG